jgi:ligand-binding SRPBCC domain-containing protein
MAFNGEGLLWRWAPFMPQHILSIDIPRPAIEVFDFLARPANLMHLAPADMRLELVQGPERVQLGSVVHWKARRMGVSQTLVNEVTAFEEGVVFAEEQCQGPFRRWVFMHRLTAIAVGTRLTEELTWEPPGGLLGLLVTAAVVHKDLDHLFAYRALQMKQLFS